MKSTIASISLAAALIAAPLLAVAERAEQAPSTDEVLELLEVTGASDMGLHVMDILLTQFQMMAPEVPENYWTELRTEIDPEELTALIIPVYQRHLSAADVDAALTFFRSAEGRNWIEKQPVMFEEAQLIGQTWGQQLGQRVFERLEREGAGTQQ